MSMDTNQRKGKSRLNRSHPWLVAYVALLAYFVTGQIGESAEPANAAQAKQKLKVLVCGAHPDDPESGAGGLISLLCRDGHDVTVLYAVTYRSGRQYFDRPEKEIRQEEASAACKILGAKPLFLEYSAGQLFADKETLASFEELLTKLQPEIVLTHWPVDTHPDHEAISTLVWRSYKRQGGWNLYYFEVNAGAQTMAFTPNIFVDVEDVRDQKLQALLKHTSQKPQGIWDEHHQPMQLRRGKECGVTHAEGFCLLEAKDGCPTLPVKTLPRREKE